MIWSALTVVPSSEEEVWSRGVLASIVTDSLIWPTSSFTSIRTRWSTPTSTFESAVALKPASSARPG